MSTVAYVEVWACMFTDVSLFGLQPGRPCECSQGQCQACDLYVDQLEDVLRYSVPKGRVACFIAEAIQVGTSYREGRLGLGYR